MLVPEDLHFDVFSAGNIFFQEHGGVSKGAFGFVAGFIEEVDEFGRFVHHAHAATATAKSRFDNERETNLLRDLEGFRALLDGVFGPRESGDAELLRKASG